MSEELADLVDRVLPGVVALSGTGPTMAAKGSGFVLDEAGHVITNHHVIAGIRPPIDASMRVMAGAKASIVGIDPFTDLALLELDAPCPFSLSFRASPPRLGELCVGIGSPFGMYPESVSLGVVSGLARTIPQATGRPIVHAIQTDAAINPGNSGGPLVDVSGEVIGVNQSVDLRGDAIGFAIPAETVGWVSQELLEHGRVVRAALGIAVVPHSVAVDGGTRTGLLIASLKSEGQRNRLRSGDVILALDGEEVDETSDLYRLLTKERIGKPTAVQLLRDGETLTLEVRPTRLEGPVASDLGR